MKNIQKIVLFLGMLTVALWLCGLILTPKTNAPDGGIYYPDGMGILSEPVDSIDVLFIGDSEVCAAFSPMELWEHSGITAYACSSVDQQLYETRAIADTVLKNQHPKLVIVETNVFYRHMNRMDALMAEINRTVPAIRYHNRWKTLTLRDFNPRVDYSYHNAFKGFYPSTEVQAADTSDYGRPSDAVNRPSTMNEKYIRALTQTFTDAGAQVIFVTSPNTMNWDATRSNGVAELAQEMGVTYLDMNALREEIPIDFQTDTRDKGDHLNTAGAIKVMNYLNHYLAENFSLPDHRGQPGFARWDEDLQVYHQMKNR